MSKYSRFEDEQEVLLAPTTKFKIIDVYLNNNMYHIELEVVPSID
jgi:hypothetical protein